MGIDNDIIHSFTISEIVVKDGRRKPDPVAVEHMAADIQRRGLRVPIEVCKMKDGRWELITGGHRLAAHKLLGRAEINGFLVDGAGDAKELDHALENLVRSELTKLERAQSVWQVKRIFQLNNPDRKHGGGRKAGEYQNPDSGSWYDAIVARSGWGRSVLEDSAKIGAKIDKEAAALLWGSMVADNQRELLALIDYSPEIQRLIAKMISIDPAVRVAQAAAQVTGASEPTRLIVPPEKQVKKVYSAFEKMTPAAKKMFAELLKSEGFL
jgi:ParB family chromosome partitioning protein